MTAPKFTPGPWKFSPGFDTYPQTFHCNAIVRTPETGTAFTITGPDRETCESNAFLASSAPDLYAALEACATELQRLRDVHLPRFEGKVGEPCNETLTAARAALAKARGLKEGE